MEPTTLDIVRTGDLGGEKIAMGFDESSIGHIMNVLTDLYSDPELAVIREYSTNARDAHIAAGIPNRAIEVTLPNLMSPYFTVKDFGPGLSVDDIEQIYSKYGASTKRGGNDQVGMLGLGCKSGLTYTSQFNVTAVKDGIKSIVTVSRMDDGRGVMEVVDKFATDEPNSVLIQVPAKKGHTFDSKARNFFRFWKPGTVLINGVEPKLLQGDKIGANIVVSTEIASDYVVMGDVAYPVEGGIYQASNRPYSTFGVIGYVGIGDVNFTPSREALHYTGRTKATIERLRNEFRADLNRTIEADISTAPTHSDAVLRHTKWSDKFGSNATSTVKYKGLVVTTAWTMPSKPSPTNPGHMSQSYYMTYSPNSYRHQVSKTGRHMDFSTLSKGLSITHFPYDDFPASRREKIKYWMQVNNVSYDKIYIFPEDALGSPWTDSCAKVTWADVKALKMPRLARAASSGLRFEVVNSSGYYDDTNELDVNLDIVYFSPADFDRHTVSNNFDGQTDTVQVVKLGKNRWDKFIRDFPTAQSIRPYIQARLKEAENALTAADRLEIGIENVERQRLQRLDETRIDDPEMVKFILAAKVQGKSISATRKAYDKACSLMRNVLHSYPATITVKTPLEKYPLLGTNLSYSKPHDDVYLYLNAKYAETSKTP